MAGRHAVDAARRLADVVRGRMLGFCLLVTQRRHLTDYAGSVRRGRDGWAGGWRVAQAFAGPPARAGALRGDSGRYRMIFLDRSLTC
ncbi:hypothetical protein GCM10020219_000410 [Nonomuraea dietziae]